MNSRFTLPNGLLAVLSCLLILATSATLAGDRLSASVDRDRIALNESLELTVEWRGAAQKTPDFSALEHQFEVLGTRQSSQTSMIGTDVDTVTRWHIALMPRETGELVIPSFRLDQSVSDALSVEVTDAVTGHGSERRYWLDSSIDREQAYPGEQILLTYRLYYASHLRQMTRDEVTIADADVVPMRERQFQAVIDGTRFQVAELRFAVFATGPGTLEIPALQLTGYSREGANGYRGGLIRGLGNPIRLSSHAHTVEILPRPEDADGNWLPARGVSLSERWSQEKDRPIRVGEPVTRTVRINAQGVKAQQLPELDFGQPDGYRIYPESPQLQQREDGNGLIASRTESHALIASRPGKLTLPPVAVQWWDSEAGQMRETVLEGRTLEVLPAEEATPAFNHFEGQEIRETVGESGGPDGRLWWWLVISIGLNLLLALVAIYLWRSRNRASGARSDTSRRLSGHTAPPGLPRAELAQLRALARSGDFAGFRNALLQWGRGQWPKNPPQTLQQLALLAAHPELARLLRELDEALYAGSDQPVTDLCEQVLTILKELDSRPGVAESATVLPPLYPKES